MKKLILLLMMMAAAPAFGQLGYVPSMKTLSCYSVSVGGWIPVAATSGGTALGYSPETVGAVGKSGTSYYPLACDANGNLSSGAILGITIPALTTGYLYYNAGALSWATISGGGNVSNTGAPTSGQYAKWTNATTIQGVSTATVLSDIGAAPVATPSFTGTSANAAGQFISTGVGPANDATDGTKILYSSPNGWLGVGASDTLHFGSGNLTAAGIPSVDWGGFTAAGVFSPTNIPIMPLTGLMYGNSTTAVTAATGAQVVGVIGATAVTNATNATSATSAGSATTAGTLTGSLSANQLLGSLTAVAPTGQSVPSCSTAASALNWTSGTGFSCNTSITANTAATATSASQVNTNTFPAASGFTSGGIPYYSSTTAEASSLILTAHGLIVGGGAATAPATIAVGGTNFPLIGQATANPVWSTITYPASCTQGGLLYGSSTTALTCGSLLTQYGVVLAGASGSSPVSTAQGALNMPLIGQGAGNPIFSTVAYPTSLNSGGVLYASSTTGISSSSAVTAHGVLVSEGAATAPVATAVGGTGFPFVGASAADPGWSTIAWLTSATQWGIPYMSTATQMSTTAALTANALIKAGSSAAPAASSMVDNATNIVTTEPIYAGNTAVIAGTGTTASATPVALTTNTLSLPSVPISTTRYGQCDLVIQSSVQADAVGIAINTNQAPTDLQILGSTLYTSTSAVVNLLPPAAVNSATSTLVMAAVALPANNTSYALHFSFSLKTTGSNAVVLGIYGQIASGGTLSVISGSSCAWLP